MDGICPRRLAPFLGEAVAAFERHGELDLEPELRKPFTQRVKGKQLLKLSPATIDRLLKPYRPQNLRQPHTQSQSLAVLHPLGEGPPRRAIKAQVPVRTFGQWQNSEPGYLQADLVAHCGESTEGFYLNTLLAVDVRTGWISIQPIWGRRQTRVGTGMHKIRQGLPFALRGLHTDNGGEFLNGLLFSWCQREGIGFTRGRAYKKNGQAYVEQKNWTVVRRLVGYDRYDTRQAYEQIQQLYRLVSDYTNLSPKSL